MTTSQSAHRPLVVHVAGLRRHIGTRWHEVRRAFIEDLACQGSRVPDKAETEADVTLESVVGGVAVSGVVRAPWTGACRRCLEPTKGVLSVPVREHYIDEGDGEETYRLAEDEVDLEPLMHDAVLLELPQAPLCSPTCKGLCPSCGANLNLETCTCRPPRDERWAVLDILRQPAIVDEPPRGPES